MLPPASFGTVHRFLWWHPEAQLLLQCRCKILTTAAGGGGGGGAQVEARYPRGAGGDSGRARQRGNGRVQQRNTQHTTHNTQHTTHNTQRNTRNTQRNTRNKKCTHVKQRRGAQKEKANSTIDLTKHTTETVNEGLKFKSGLEGGMDGSRPSLRSGPVRLVAV